MAHKQHHPRIFHKRGHSLATIGIVLLPVVILFLIGAYTHTNWQELFLVISVSFVRLIVAYALSVLLGVAVALILGGSRLSEPLLPFFDVLQNIPSFALIPLFVLAFGYSNLMIIFFAASAMVWPIFFYCLSAIRNVRTELSDAATIFGAHGTKRIFDFYLPLSFPAIITGSIVGISIGWEAVIGIEIIGHMLGIGTFLNDASVGGSQTPVLVGISILLLLTFFLNRIIWIPLLHKTRFYGE